MAPTGKLHDEMYPRQSGNQGGRDDFRCPGGPGQGGRDDFRRPGGPGQGGRDDFRRPGGPGQGGRDGFRREGEPGQRRPWPPTRAVQGQRPGRANNLQTDETLVPSINPRMGTSYHRSCGSKKLAAVAWPVRDGTPKTNQFPQTG